MKFLCAMVLALFSCVIGNTARAQLNVSASTVSAALVDGVEAQYRAALILDRRLSDARTAQIIATAETRMRQARANVASARSNLGAAQTELEAARTAYTQLVLSVPIRDASALIEIEAFRAEFEGRLPDATPALVDAYQQFADGDRTAAWSTIATLLQARAQARQLAARRVAGGELNGLAKLRDVMRSHGEATIADVYQIWRQAAQIDPEQFDAWYQTGIISAFFLRDMIVANEAGNYAVRAARNANERRLAFLLRGEIALTEGRLDQAGRDTDEAITATREVLAAGSGDINRQFMTHELVTALAKRGDVYLAQEQFNDAAGRYTEAMRLAEQLYGEVGPTYTMQLMLNFAYQKMGDVFFEAYRVAEADVYYARSVLIVEGLAENNPTAHELLRTLSVALNKEGDALSELERPTEALALYQRSLTLIRRAIDEDPSFVEYRFDLPLTLERVGEEQVRSGRNRQGLATLRDAISAYREYGQLRPSDTRTQEAVARAEQRIEDYSRP